MSLILLVEEQQDVCGLVQRLLMRMGHTVVCVEHASEADLWLRNNSPELVILGTGRQGELALERLQVLESHGVEGSRVLLGARADARELVIRKYGHRVREVFDSPQGLDALEAMVRRAFGDRTHRRGEEGERRGAG